MPPTIRIENIEEMRRQQGIEDDELRLEIRALRAGDYVHLTLLTAAGAFEVVTVRITSVRGAALRGKLAKRASTPGLSRHPVGTPITFTTDHIPPLPRPGEEHVGAPRPRAPARHAGHQG